MTTTQLLGAAGPRTVVARFLTALARRDLESLLMLYAADAAVALAGRREAAGRVAIRSAWSAAFAAELALGLPGPADERVVDDDDVLVTQVGGLAFASVAGADEVVRTLLLRQEGEGSWLIASDGSYLAGFSLAPGGVGSVRDLPNVA